MKASNHSECFYYDWMEHIKNDVKNERKEGSKGQQRQVQYMEDQSTSV